MIASNSSAPSLWDQSLGRDIEAMFGISIPGEWEGFPGFDKLASIRGILACYSLSFAENGAFSAARRSQETGNRIFSMFFDRHVSRLLLDSLQNLHLDCSSIGIFQVTQTELWLFGDEICAIERFTASRSPNMHHSENFSRGQSLGIND
jgi:hypothetical protein